MRSKSEDLFIVRPLHQCGALLALDGLADADQDIRPEAGEHLDQIADAECVQLPPIGMREDLGPSPVASVAATGAQPRPRRISLTRCASTGLTVISAGFG